MNGSIKNNINPEKVIQQMKVEIEKLLLGIAEHLVGQINLNAPRGTTPHLSGSFGYELKPFENGIGVEFGSPLEYASYVEFGTRPHWMPIAPLLAWVEQKIQPHVLAIGVNFNSGKAAPTGRSTKQLKGDKKAQAIMAIAKAIQFKIARVGTPAVKYVQKSLTNMGLPHSIIETQNGYSFQVNCVPLLKKHLPEVFQKIKLV